MERLITSGLDAEIVFSIQHRVLVSGTGEVTCASNQFVIHVDQSLWRRDIKDQVRRIDSDYLTLWRGTQHDSVDRTRPEKTRGRWCVRSRGIRIAIPPSVTVVGAGIATVIVRRRHTVDLQIGPEEIKALGGREEVTAPELNEVRPSSREFNHKKKHKARNQ